MITTSPGCQCLASAKFISLNHTVQYGRSEGHRKCAVAWRAISYMLHGHGEHAYTAHKWCLADMGYACQSDDERTFIILWLMLIDLSSKDKKRGTIEDMGGYVIYCKCFWHTVASQRCYTSLILESALPQWDWLCYSETTWEPQLVMVMTTLKTPDTSVQEFDDLKTPEIKEF